jgi:hypothetical protein
VVPSSSFMALRCWTSISPALDQPRPEPGSWDTPRTHQSYPHWAILSCFPALPSLPLLMKTPRKTLAPLPTFLLSADQAQCSSGDSSEVPLLYGKVTHFFQWL